MSTFALIKDTRYELTLEVMAPSAIPAVTSALYAQGFRKITGQSPAPGDAPILRALFEAGASGDYDLVSVTACVALPAL